MRLSRRRSLSAIICLLAVLQLATPAAAQQKIAGGDFRCGVNWTFESTEFEVRGEMPRLHDSQTNKKVGTTIVLNAGAGLAARPAALAAWNEAVAIWEAILEDSITVTINGDFAALGAGVLGGTSSSTYFAGWATIRDAMVADAAVDEAIALQLPTAAQVTVAKPGSIAFANNMSATRANLSALGFDMNAIDISISGSIQADASMTFSTGFESNFDYDPSDGITAGKFDFVAIVVHEIGHALGFVSSVDNVDFWIANGSIGQEVRPNTLDAYRINPGIGGANFTLAARIQQPGNVNVTQVCYDGSGDLGMSTGRSLGDGNQASHFKADEITGTFLGIMDPTLAPGQHEEITDNDKRMFGLIGWDITIGGITDCNNNGVEDATDISGGTSQDCNANNVPDECDIANATSTDVNGNGIPDECETDCNGNNIPDDWDLSQGTSQDCNANNVPDECDIAGVTSNDVNGNGIPDECETDCNGNNIPDAWDISQGISEDCNSNNIPDECDIISGFSQDSSSNGIPDECEPTSAPELELTRYDARAFPNPFNPRTMIEFDLPSAGRVELAIYDVAGRRVVTLVDRAYEVGRHQVSWSGEAADGASVASGVYFAVYNVNGQSSRVKLTLVK